MTTSNLMAELRLVQTQFEIESNWFTSRLPAEKVSQIESDLSRLMASEGAASLGFVNWRGTTDLQENPDAILTLKLVEEEVSLETISGFKFFLKYTGQIREGVVKDFDAQPYEKSPKHPCAATPEIYRSWQLDLPDHSPAQLEADLRCHVSRHFSEFRKDLISDYLDEIPLSDELIVDVENSVVGLPWRWDELQAANESRFFVKFGSRLGDTTREGELKLSPTTVRWGSSVQCLIRYFFFVQLIVSEEGEAENWVDECASALLEPNLEHLEVFVEEYEMAPRTTITEP